MSDVQRESNGGVVLEGEALPGLRRHRLHEAAARAAWIAARSASEVLYLFYLNPPLILAAACQLFA